MDCKKAQSILSTYLDKKVSEKDKDLVELHLRDCEDCRSFLADLKDTIKLTGSLQPMQPPAHMLEDIEKAIAKLPEKKTFFSLPLWFRVPIEVASTAAVLVLILFVTRSLVLREFAAQPKDDVLSRWVPGYNTAPVVTEQTGQPAPVEESKGIENNAVTQADKANNDMDLSSSAEKQETAAGEAKLKVQELNQAPVAWEKEMSAPKAVPTQVTVRKADTMFGEQDIIAPEYNINIELGDLSKGVNELTAQVYNFNGTFIGQPEATNENTTHKEMNFKIPRDKYYQFVWNVEKIGTVKNINPLGGDKPNIVEQITVHLSIDLVSQK
jgi:hypothetical protein